MKTEPNGTNDMNSIETKPFYEKYLNMVNSFNSNRG